MKEWQLQKLLTRRWSVDGITLADEEVAFLAAWEVMTLSWLINDARKKWNEPSIDFLAIDCSGSLVAIELKRSVDGSLPAWRVLCQVTHRAVELANSFSRERLDSAFRACASGDHGRVAPRDGSLRSELHRFYGRDVNPTPRAMRRAVAATRWSRHWAGIVDEFNELPAADLPDRLDALGLLDGTPKNREAERLASVSDLRTDLQPVQFLTIGSDEP